MKWSCGLQLRLRTGPGRGITYPVDAPVLKIGRARTPGERQPGWLRINDDTVSRLHCELFWQEDRQCFRLLHRSTTNSTYVNGELVEDVEVFSGDILELGHTVLELQEADRRWSQQDTKAIQDWPVRPHEMGAHSGQEEKARRIPGATVNTVEPVAKKKVGLGPAKPFCLVAENGETYLLNQTRVRLGGSTPPPEPEDEEAPKPPLFDAQYDLGDGYGYYNLILRYDELSQNYLAARVGPDAREVAIARHQSGLIWRSNFPEGVEVALLPGDMLRVGELEVQYMRLPNNAKS